MSRSFMLLVVLASARAFAQAPPETPPPPAPATDDAKHHFEQGVALFNDGNYSGALAEFEQADKLKPAPFVRYNIGLTQKALFRYAEAIASVQQYLDGSSELAPERRAEAQQIIAEMKALLADVTVVVSPAGAAIAIDGRAAGVAPLAAPLAIAAGTHKLEVTADGYEPQKRELMVTAGTPLSFELSLRAIPKTGKVRISASVPRATVAVDGHPAGIAPLELELDAGGHMIEITAPAYQPRRDELVIAAGQTRQLAVQLDKVIVPKHAWYRHWYVWAGAATALVGGGVGCGLAGCFDKQQSPLPGTLSPGAGGVQ